MKRKANSNYRPGYHRKEAGVTLVELMVGVVVGLIVLSGVLYTFLVTYIGSKDVLNSTRLNEETSAILELMTGEVRRSGHWYVSAASAATMLNPFIDDGEVDIAVVGTDCVLYRYDRDGDGDVTDAGEYLGFKLDDIGGVGVIRFRKSAGSASMSDCNDVADTWETISDDDFMSITDFTVTDRTACTTGDVASDAVADCEASGEDYVVVRDLQISISAEVIRDTDWSTILRDSVRIRNDFVKDL